MDLRLKLPPRFVEDCIECDCDVGEWDGATLTCTPPQLAEFVSRARHYAHGGLDAAERGLALSARASLKRLSKLGVL